MRSEARYSAPAAGCPVVGDRAGPDWARPIPGTDTTSTVPQFARGRLGAETQAAYYDRPVTAFASYQRVLCNKCHAKD